MVSVIGKHAVFPAGDNPNERRRALLFQRLGDTKAARDDAEQAANIAPESEGYRAFLERFPAEEIEAKPD